MLIISLIYLHSFSLDKTRLLSVDLEHRLNINMSSESEDQDQMWKALEHDGFGSSPAVSDVEENIAECEVSDDNSMSISELHSTVIPNIQIEEATVCNGNETETLDSDEDSSSDIYDARPKFLKNPGKWIEHGPLDQTEFDAVATYVDYNGVIYLLKQKS